MSGDFRLRTKIEPPESGLSTYLERLVEPKQVLPDELRDAGFGLVRLKVGDVRALGLEVVHIPDTSDQAIGHAHVEVRPPPGASQLSGTLRSRLAELAGRPDGIVHQATPATS